jgi:hypothetical protein
MDVSHVPTAVIAAIRGTGVTEYLAKVAPITPA